MKNISIVGMAALRQEGAKQNQTPVAAPQGADTIPQKVQGTPAVVAAWSSSQPAVTPPAPEQIPQSPQAIPQGQEAATAGAAVPETGSVPGQMGPAAEEEPEIPTPAEAKKDADLSLMERMIEAQKKAKERKDRFKIPKNTRYGDYPIEAYARLARARSQMDVNAASGYARRQISQLQAAKRQDTENAPRIQAAINQLQKAVMRAGKKKRDIQREGLAEARRRRMVAKRQLREAQVAKQELRKRQKLRMIREHGYIREAEIDDRFQAQMAQTRMEFRTQLENLAGSTDSGAVRAQYEAQLAADGAAPAAAPELSIEA